jgi:Flp pilus assembly protein TadD
VALTGTIGCRLPGGGQDANAVSATGGAAGQDLHFSRPAEDVPASPLWKKPIDAASNMVAASRNKLSRPKKSARDRLQRRSETPARETSADKETGSMLAMARLVERGGEVEKAEKMYRAILEKSPGEPTAQHRLGVVAARRGRLDEAEALMTQAVASDPGNAELLNDLGYALFLQGSFPDAEERLREALALKPDDDAARTNLGLALGMQGKTDLAMSQFRAVASESEAHANMAFVLAQRGQLELAEEYYHIALDLDNTLRPAAEGLVQLDHLEKVSAAVARRQRQRQLEENPGQLAEFSAEAPQENHPLSPSPIPTTDHAATVATDQKNNVEVSPASASMLAGTPPARTSVSNEPTIESAGETPDQSTKAWVGTGDETVVQKDEWKAKYAAPVVDGASFRNQFQGAPVFRGHIQTVVADEPVGEESEDTQLAKFEAPLESPAALNEWIGYQGEKPSTLWQPTEDPSATGRPKRFVPAPNFGVFQSFVPAAGRPAVPLHVAPSADPAAAINSVPRPYYPMRRATWIGSSQPLSSDGAASIPALQPISPMSDDPGADSR